MINKGFLTVEENKEFKYLKISFKGYQKYVLFVDDTLEYAYAILDKINNKLILFKYPTVLYDKQTPEHVVDLMAYQIKMIEECFVKRKEILPVPKHNTYNGTIEVLNKMLF